MEHNGWLGAHFSQAPTLSKWSLEPAVDAALLKLHHPAIASAFAARLDRLHELVCVRERSAFCCAISNCCCCFWRSLSTFSTAALMRHGRLAMQSVEFFAKVCILLFGIGGHLTVLPQHSWELVSDVHAELPLGDEVRVEGDAQGTWWVRSAKAANQGAQPPSRVS